MAIAQWESIKFVERRPEDDKRDERTTDQHAIIWIENLFRWLSRTMPMSSSKNGHAQERF